MANEKVTTNVIVNAGSTHLAYIQSEKSPPEERAKRFMRPKSDATMPAVSIVSTLGPEGSLLSCGGDRCESAITGHAECDHSHG